MVKLSSELPEIVIEYCQKVLSCGRIDKRSVIGEALSNKTNLVEVVHSSALSLVFICK